MANQWLTGSGVPSTGIGQVTDYYRDTVNNLVYYRENAFTWVVVPAFTPSPDGIGTTWLHGNVPPLTGQGSDGDYYYDEVQLIVYRKDGATWVPKGSLDFIGIYGVQWGNGLGAPANIPSLNNLPAGSFYLDVATSDIYYKNPSLVWEAKGQLGLGSTGLDAIATAADRVQTGLDRVQTGLDRAAATATVGASSNIQILNWAYVQAFAITSAARNGNDVITTALIVWPDGATGTFTTDTINTTYNAIDAWHATHILDAVTKTVTQTAVTRNSNGAVTAQPVITIS